MGDLSDSYLASKSFVRKLQLQEYRVVRQFLNLIASQKYEFFLKVISKVTKRYTNLMEITVGKFLPMDTSLFAFVWQKALFQMLSIFRNENHSPNFWVKPTMKFISFVVWVEFSENDFRLCPVLEFSSSCFGQISLLICKPYLESPCQIYASDNIVLRGPPKTLPPLWVFFFFSSNVESSFFMLIGLLCSLVGFCFYPNTIFLEIENNLTFNCVDILFGGNITMK